MTRRLSISMAFSAAIHLAAFVIADRLLIGDSTPSAVSTPLLVNIESVGASPETTGQDARETLIDTASPASEGTTRSTQSDSTETIAAAESRSRETSGEESRSPAPVTSAAATVAVESTPEPDEARRTSKPAIAALVTSSNQAEWSVPVRASLSSREEEMLNRKISEWTRHMHDVTELGDVSWSDGDREYRARFSTVPGDVETGIQRVLVEISTDIDDQRYSTRMQVKRLAFSSFAQFVNRWDPNVLLHDDVLDGRFHSNSRFNVAYDRDTRPVFHQVVTTAARGVDIERTSGAGPRGDMFQGGLETGVRPIRLPSEFSAPIDRFDVDDDNVHFLREDTRIIFRADGSYVRQSTGSDEPGEAGMLSPGTTYFFADPGSIVSVRGIVNGKVLVYSPERIVIEDDIVYERDPDAEDGSDDILGLVSDKNVEVAGPDMTGPGDLMIQAAIYAKRRFVVKKKHVGKQARLSLYGSLTAGTLSATEPRFATQVRFDPRLDRMRPPGFPVTDSYELESWRADWTVEPIN